MERFDHNERPDFNRRELDHDNDDGINAFNTEDALKQRDNPTNPVAMGTARSNGFNNLDLNSSR